jgi:hypothetical protein
MALEAVCDHKCGPNYVNAKRKTTYVVGWSSATYEAADMPCLSCGHALPRKERSVGTFTYGNWQDVKQSECAHADFLIVPQTIKYRSVTAFPDYVFDGKAECKRCLQRWNMEARTNERGPVDWRKPVPPPPAVVTTAPAAAATTSSPP